VTTPNQLPIDRAFVIGGQTADAGTDVSYPGNNFGQDFTDNAVRSLFEIPITTFANMLEVFTSLLLRIPLEALKVFAPIIPGGLDNFTDVLTGVNAIVGSLTDVVQFLTVDVFTGFLAAIGSGDPEAVAQLLKDGLDKIEALIDQLLSALGLDAVGTWLDKIFDLADGFGGWFGDSEDLMGNFDDMLGGVLGLFGLGSLNDLATGDPTDILSSFVTGQLNPLALLEDGGIRDFVKGMIDQLTSILRFIPFIGDTLADSLTNFADGMQAQTETVIGTASSLSQLAAAMGDGEPDADDFERTTLGANWRTIFSDGGAVSLDGHDLAMTHNDDTDFILLKTDKQAKGNFQTGEIVLGSAPGYNTLVLDSARGHNDVWLRCSNFTDWATRTGIRCRWSAQNKNVKISAFVSGTEVTTIFNGALQSASAGSSLKLEAGVLGVARQYIVRINGAIVKDVVESGTASALGPAYLYRGLGGATENLIGVATPDPGKVKVWTVTG
jgi:hypothetical protein